MWREDVLAVAWQAVRRNGGAAGVDGETVADIESQGVDRWLGALARDLKAGTYRPRAVRQVLIPKKQRGKFRPLGIPCLRDRVAQTAAMLVLSPIFEADLQPEQYAYRPGRGAHDAVRRVHRLLTTGHREVVDADLSDYYGQIPHGDLLRSIARRVSDGRLLGWVKAWLEMAVEEDDGRGGRRRTNRARRERKGTPQGAPISPLFSNIYMRRFILGWKVLDRRQPGEEGVDQALAAGVRCLLPHPADGRRRDPEPHLAAVGVEVGPEPQRPPVRLPGGVARRQGPRPAGPVLAPARDDDRQLAAGHGLK